MAKKKTVPTSFKIGFLASLDGRTELSKLLREHYQSIISDLGGEEEISHIKRTLIERFVWLEAILQSIEQELASGKVSPTEAIGRWVQAVNALSGLAKTIGIDKLSSPAPWLNVLAKEETND